MAETDEWDALNAGTGREEFDHPHRFDLSSVSQVTELARRVRPAPPPHQAAPPPHQAAPPPHQAAPPRPQQRVQPHQAQHPAQAHPYQPPYQAPQPPPHQNPSRAPRGPLDDARARQPRPPSPPPPPHTAPTPNALTPNAAAPEPRAEAPGEDDRTPPPRFTHRSLVRPYARTGGRTRPANDLALEALVVTTDRGRGFEGVESPEQRFICELCLEVHSVAEIAAFAKLPLGVVKIVVDDLAEAGAVDVRQPGFVLADRDSRDFMERILTGLRAL